MVPTVDQMIGARAKVSWPKNVIHVGNSRATIGITPVGDPSQGGSSIGFSYRTTLPPPGSSPARVATRAAPKVPWAFIVAGGDSGMSWIAVQSTELPMRCGVFVMTGI